MKRKNFLNLSQSHSYTSIWFRHVHSDCRCVPKINLQFPSNTNIIVPVPCTTIIPMSPCVMHISLCHDYQFMSWLHTLDVSILMIQLRGSLNMMEGHRVNFLVVGGISQGVTEIVPWAREARNCLNSWNASKAWEERGRWKRSMGSRQEIPLLTETDVSTAKEWSLRNLDWRELSVQRSRKKNWIAPGDWIYTKVFNRLKSLQTLRQGACRPGSMRNRRVVVAPNEFDPGKSRVVVKFVKKLHN